MADTEKFYSLVTKVGQAKISNAISFGNKINFTKMKLGDGNGSYYEPTEDQTDLVNEVYEVNISSVSVDDENPNWVHIEAIIPSNVGGFTVREYGVYDDVDDLIGICKCAETYKPIISDGSTKELLIDMVLCVVNADVIELKIDPTIIYAKKEDIIELRNEIINGNVNIKFERAKGTANNLSLTMPTTLYDGYSKNFIATKDSTTNVKINTSYPLYKQNTTKSPKLTTGKAYTIWFNAVGNNFFLKASAEGDVVAGDVLANKIFSNDDDTGLVGTMPNNPKITKTLKVGESYTVPKGYNNGSVIKAETIKDASSTSGVTLDLADKLVEGVKAFDKDGNLITGTATIQSLGGINVLAKGTCTLNSSNSSSNPITLLASSKYDSSKKALIIAKVTCGGSNILCVHNVYTLEDTTGTYVTNYTILEGIRPSGVNIGLLINNGIKICNSGSYSSNINVSWYLIYLDNFNF